METIRVFLVWHHPLLRDTVQAVLQQEGIILVGVAHGSRLAEADLPASPCEDQDALLENTPTPASENGQGSLLEQLHALQPDALLIEESEDGLAERLLAYLPRLCRARLVYFRMADNKVHIYHHEERSLTQIVDLIDALQG
jgi:hypothetical protein